MSNVVTFKMLNGLDIIGKLNTEEAVRSEYAHIPGAIILDDALIIAIQVLRSETGENRAQISFDPVSIPVEGQKASRIALTPSTVNFQYTAEGVYVDGYLKALSPIMLPPGGGGKIIT